jgi:hypothetical protein
MTRTVEELARENALMKSYLAKYEGLRRTVQDLVAGHPTQGFEYNPTQITPVQFQRQIMGHVISTLSRALQLLSGALPSVRDATLSVPALEGKSAMVLYFATEQAREMYRQRVLEDFEQIHEVRCL